MWTLKHFGIECSPLTENVLCESTSINLYSDTKLRLSSIPWAEQREMGFDIDKHQAYYLIFGSFSQLRLDWMK